MATRMDIDALESAAGQVNGLAGNFGSELASLSSLVQSTHDFWDDPAQAAFEAKHEQFKATMNQFIDALNKYSSAMRSYAESQRNLQVSAAQSIMGI